MEYLYSQTGKIWLTTPFDLDTPDNILVENESMDSLDEGFEDDEFESDLTIPMASSRFCYTYKI